MRNLPGFMRLLHKYHIYSCKSQNFVPVVNLESRVPTYTRERIYVTHVLVTVLR